jgi:hypothetical protein
MIYGTASCLGVPWETVIKEFRESLGSDVYAHVADYGEALIGFISRNRALFPENEQEQFAFRYAADKYERIREDIREHVREEFARGSMTEARVSELAAGVIKQREEFWKACPSRGKLPRDFRRRVRERYGDQIRKAHDETFEGLRLDSRLRERLMRLTLDSWCMEPDLVCTRGEGADPSARALRRRRAVEHRTLGCSRRLTPSAGQSIYLPTAGSTSSTATQKWGACTLRC